MVCNTAYYKILEQLKISMMFIALAFINIGYCSGYELHAGNSKISVTTQLLTTLITMRSANTNLCSVASKIHMCK